jgi:hypothetical protein
MGIMQFIDANCSIMSGSKREFRTWTIFVLRFHTVSITRRYFKKNELNDMFRYMCIVAHMQACPLCDTANDGRLPRTYYRKAAPSISGVCLLSRSPQAWHMHCSTQGKYTQHAKNGDME